MQQLLAVRAPFSLDQSLAFMRRFSPCQGDHLVDDDGVTTAVVVGKRAVAVRLGRGPDASGAPTVSLEHAAVDAAGAAAIAAHAARWLSLDDDLAGFYAAAEGDTAPFRTLVAGLHGLHHVRFPTLADIAVYAVIMQRTPIALAGKLRRGVLAHLGLAVTVDDQVLRAMPPLPELAGLDTADWLATGVGARRAAILPGVIRGVAMLGEAWLRTAPYAEAQAALEAIKGIGPFSATAILLRGLGRMDHVPLAMSGFAGPALAVYGASWDPRATVRRYGAALGYWSYYLKTGVPRGLHHGVA